MLPIHERQTYASNFRWVTESRLFHGGDTGSTPVRDANSFNHLRDITISPRVQKGPLTKSPPYEYLEEASSQPCSALPALRCLPLEATCPRRVIEIEYLIALK